MKILKSFNIKIWNFTIYLDYDTDDAFKFKTTAKINKDGILEFAQKNNINIDPEKIDKILKEIYNKDYADIDVTETIPFNKKDTNETVEWTKAERGLEMFAKTFAQNTKIEQYISRPELIVLLKRYIKKEEPVVENKEVVQSAVKKDEKKDEKLPESNVDSDFEVIKTNIPLIEPDISLLNNLKKDRIYTANNILNIIKDEVYKKNGDVMEEYIEEDEIDNKRIFGNVVIIINTREKAAKSKDDFIKDVLKKIAERIGSVYKEMNAMKYVKYRNFVIRQGNNIDEIFLEYSGSKANLDLVARELNKIDKGLSDEFKAILTDSLNKNKN